MSKYSVREYRIAAGVSVVGKIRELGFFVERIFEVSRELDERHRTQHYPLNEAIDRLNFYFSAFMNSIQGVKDASATAMGLSSSLKWDDVSPTYGEFIFYCRNAIAHDGSHLINGSRDCKHFIVGPLRRLDSRGNLKELHPPAEDAATLCLNIAKEVLSALRRLLDHHGVDIPTASGVDFQSAMQDSLNNDFVPAEIRALTQANLPRILESLKDVKVDIVHRLLATIGSVQANLQKHGSTS
jgi:hypothetical protein